MSPNMGPTQVQIQGTPHRRSSQQNKTPKRFKERGGGSPTKQQNRTNGFNSNLNKQLQRSSPKSAFHPVASSHNNGMLPMNFKRSSPLQTRCSPQGFQIDEESKLRESPSYAGAKFSEAPPPDCLPSPPQSTGSQAGPVPGFLTGGYAFGEFSGRAPVGVRSKVPPGA